jgi:flagellar biosynthesis/type III secretory pathway protein FliH
MGAFFLRQTLEAAKLCPVPLEYNGSGQSFLLIGNMNMKEFLETHGTEVTNMLLSGWNMDEALAVSKEEGYEDGYEEGVEYGEKLGEQKKQQELILALRDVLSPEVIAEKFQVSLEYVRSVLNESLMVCEAEIPYSVNTKEK